MPARDRGGRVGAAGPCGGSGGLLAALARGLARHDRRVHVLQDDLLGDDDRSDVLTAGDVVNEGLEHLLPDRWEPTGAGGAEDGLVGDRLEGAVGELEVYPVELEELPVLAY